ncbi:MAG: class I SAM-dependent methyltransferase [Candidatus Methanoperedenaceae archaeon HGW-Methanoperedenaceae-1]|jgi:ubiquinone/menaquinone biosynthesis C-methylase UbiE|nr:MAG: class I SAM-dependent methyltransferase [Candidatus Methanoperedenaceae archaeon HGW-Methanoperedenaceae-1]
MVLTMAHRFNIKKAELLDSPDRRSFLDPDSILGKLGLEKDMVFADLGCGTGYFSIPASAILRKVYAVDVQQEMLDLLNTRIKKGKLTNIEPVLSDGNSIPLANGSADIIFMANVFHELDDKEHMLAEARRVLSDGKLVIIDWKKIEMDIGPPVSERFSPEEVISICRNNGFEPDVNTEAGPYNYMIVFSLSH